MYERELMNSSPFFCFFRFFHLFCFCKKPIPGGPVERYIALLEDKVNAAEDQFEQMCEDHRLEIEELEQEFDVRIRFFCSWVGEETSHGQIFRVSGVLELIALSLSFLF